MQFVDRSDVRTVCARSVARELSISVSRAVALALLIDLQVSRYTMRFDYEMCVSISG